MIKLIPYRKKNKWGFSNPEKEVIINCLYDDIIVPFSETNFNLALVAQNNKTCWLNGDGIEVTPFADTTHQFTDKGISVIILNSEIDTASVFPNCLFVGKGGTVLFENDFLTSNSYQNGNCIVMNQERKYGVINSQGQIIHPFNETDYITLWEKIGKPYTYDKARTKENTISELQKYTTENRYSGYKNKVGEVIIPPQFYMAQDFREGMASVAKREREFYFINEQGNRVTDKTYYFCQSFENGIAKVVTDELNENPHIHSRWGVEYYIPDSAKWGYIDIDGNEFWED